MKFDDRLTNIVYFADHLSERYPAIFPMAKVNLEANGITVKTIKNTENIWIRDWMPVQVGDRYVKFQYKTVGYEDYPHLHVPDKVWSPIAVPAIISDLTLDGGGIVRGNGKAIVTNKIVADNPESKLIKIIAELERLLESEIILIPMEPGDDLGHSDGICKFVDEKTVLINDYSSIFDKDKRFIKYSEKITQIFENSGLDVEILPYGYGEWDWGMTETEFRRKYPKADDTFNPAIGYYLNFLLVRGVILLPVFNLKQDWEAMRTMRRLYPDFNIVACDCSELAWAGGCINCVSWNITV